MIRVVACQTRLVIRTLAQPVGGIAHRTITRELLEVELRDESGRVGRGEAGPLPGYSLDTIESAQRAIRLLTIGLPRRFADLAEVEAQLAEAPPAVRAALECALCDLLAQQSDAPLWSLLRGETSAPSLRLSAVLHGPEAELAAEAAKLREAGYTTLKRKIDADTNVDALLSGLRLDANRAYSLSAWQAIAPRLAALEPELVEEPVNVDLRQATGASLALAADESLAARTSVEALELVDTFTPVVRAIVVKPARDGLIGGLRLAQRARASNVQVIVTHLWDGPVGHLAAVHLALALGRPTSPAQGLAPQPGLGDERFTRIIAGGLLSPPSGPGLSDG